MENSGRNLGKPISEFNKKSSGGTECFSCRLFYRDHEKFGKSTIRFTTFKNMYNNM